MANDRRNSSRTDTSAINRALARVLGVKRGVEAARKKAIASVGRKLKTETSRAVSDLQLNAAARSLVPYLQTSTDPDGVTVSASGTRLPIKLFKPRVSKTTGVRVKIWHERGEEHWPIAFKHDGNIKQRVGRSRLPITTRVGPSLSRALGSVRTGNSRTLAAGPGREKVVDRLKGFAQQTLSDELARLKKAGF
jgi:hypothetical protein